MAYYIRLLLMHEDKEENKVSLFIYRNINVSINITSYYELLCGFLSFFTELQFQLYSNILNNMLTKTDYATSLSVHLINLLLHHDSWLLWELMIVPGVPLEYLFKRWVGNKDMIYCTVMAFFNKYVRNSPWLIFFFWFAKAILISENIN